MTQEQANTIAEIKYPYDDNMLDRDIKRYRIAYAKCLMDMNPLIEAAIEMRESITCDNQTDGAMTDSEEEGLRFRLNAFASLPTLNIGMGEIKESEVLNVCEIYADNYPIEGRITVNKVAMRKALEVFLIAQTKAVTVEAIVAECENQVEDDVEGWTSYDWEVFKKQLTARLIKLTQP